MIRSQTELEAMRDQTLSLIHQLNQDRSQPGRSEALRSSDSITASLAAVQLNTLEYVLGNQESPTIRSKLLNRR